MTHYEFSNYFDMLPSSIIMDNRSVRPMEVLAAAIVAGYNPRTGTGNYPGKIIITMPNNNKLCLSWKQS